MAGFKFDAEGFMENMPNFLDAFQGISLINEGASISIDGGNLAAGSYRMAGKQALEGGLYSAEVYRNSGKAASIATAYNQALDQLNTNRQKSALSREISTTTSYNRAVQGGSGISLSSKSYLSVANKVMADYERKNVQMTNSAIQRQQQMGFEGQLAVMNAENQARNAEYQGQVAKANYENQARQAEYEGQVGAYKANSKAGQATTDLVKDAFSYFSES